MTGKSNRHILLAEDNKADVFLIREAIKLANVSADLHVVSDGEKAVAFIDAAESDDHAPCPTLILLDLNLPKKNGLEVLQHVRSTRKCAGALVLIITSSDSERDRQETSRLGASGYFRKPSGYNDYLKLGEVVKNLLSTGPVAPQG